MILFIGNLNKLTTQKELDTLLSPFGIILKLKLMVDRITYRSRGYAYVDIQDETDAQKVIQKLNTSTFMNNCLIVSTATKYQLKTLVW